MGIYKSLAENVWEVLKFLRDEFIDRQIEDPANTNNIVSDTLTIQEKMVIAKAAGESLKKNYWNEIIK